MKLTDLAIRKFPIPEGRQKTYWDQGLGVRVSPGGTKSFVLKHNNKHITLGRYPETSLKDARRAAAEHKVSDRASAQLQSLSEARRAYLMECQGKIRPSFSLPPLDLFAGVRPSQAANSRPLRN